MFSFSFTLARFYQREGNNFFTVYQDLIEQFTNLAGFHSPTWPDSIHQFGRIPFTSLAGFHSPTCTSSKK